MGFRINTNVAALNAKANADLNSKSLDASLSRLSSGLRINSAADDASGMAIADSLRSQANTLGQAISNGNDALGILQTADKAMDEQLKILDTIKTKATQAAQDGQSLKTRTNMHPSIMLATIAIFLAMIVILNSMLYKPLLKFMDERNDSIKNDENKVKENSQEVLCVNDELEVIHINTREEIQKIKQSAIAAAKEEAEQILRSKKEELERKMASFYADLAIQKKELQEHLNIHLPELKQALQNNIKKI
ncbi:FoF1 ATP synthase subunit B' [Campylobacter jejuni]|uniref:FoF1 ATP synthase subunit B' n=1 Tax=Campylobacter jejuni TaxID=197 RepID=UPI00111EC76D